MESVVEFVAPWCSPDDLVCLFLTSKSIGKVMEREDFVNSLYHRIHSVLTPGDRIRLEWHYPPTFPFYTNLFTYLMGHIHKYYTTLRSKRHFSHLSLYEYLLRCITYGRIDIAKKTISVEESDSLADNSSIDKLFDEAVDRGGFESIEYLYRVFGRDEIIIVLSRIARNNDFSLFKKVYEGCATVCDRKMFREGMRNVTPVIYPFCIPNADYVKVVILRAGVDCKWEQAVEMVQGSITTLTRCYGLAKVNLPHRADVDVLIKRKMGEITSPVMLRVGVRMYDGLNLGCPAYWEEKTKFVTIMKDDKDERRIIVMGTAATERSVIISPLNEEEIIVAKSMGFQVV